MRKIKFRGKRLDNGEWAYGYYVAHRTNIGDNKLRHLIICNEEMSHQHPVDPETIGQYIGQYDKNGNDLYENHKVKQGWNGHIGKIWFNVSAGRYYVDGSDRPDAIQFSAELEIVDE